MRTLRSKLIWKIGQTIVANQFSPQEQRKSHSPKSQQTYRLYLLSEYRNAGCLDTRYSACFRSHCTRCILQHNESGTLKINMLVCIFLHSLYPVLLYFFQPHINSKCVRSQSESKPEGSTICTSKAVLSPNCGRNSQNPTTQKLRFIQLRTSI